MSILKAVVQDFIIFFDVRKRSGKIRTAVLIVVCIIAFVLLNGSSNSVIQTPPESLQTVFVSDVASLAEQNSFSVIGKVESRSQAKIQTETSGRVTNVNVSLGERVFAGQIIARLENASEYASLLQAEGVYEASQAAAAVSDVSVASTENSLQSAENNALDIYKNAYAIINSVLGVELDQILADPEFTYRTQYVPKDFFNKEGRVNRLYKQLQKTLETRGGAGFAPATIETKLNEAVTDTNSLLELVQHLNNLISDNEIDYTQTSTETSYLSTLASIEQKLIASNVRLQGAQTTLDNARKALTQAEIGGTGQVVSVANAQVKQALGALRAAQANFAKTVIRTPIAGTVNELQLKTGDYVGQSADVALIANNNALEITTYVGEFDVARIEVGQQVLLNNSSEGVVTAISPAVDSATKKTEIKIGTESDKLKNGDSVTVTFKQASSSDTEKNIFIPITAIKFAATDGSIFTVENNELVAHPVEIGQINGSFVEVLEGVDFETQFVVDARGLSEGQKVEPIIK